MNAPAAPRPNVLLVSVDDLSVTALGCYGRAHIKTPNIDALAARGVRFDLAYCQYPLCNPSRVSMLIGQRPDTAKVHDLHVNFRDTVPDAVTLPQLFRRNGYFTARSGKIFHYGVPREIGTSGKDDPASWDEVVNPIGTDKTEESKLKVLTKGTGTTTIGFAMAWREMDGPDEEQTDGKGASAAIELIERAAKAEKPFFIGLGFYRPHTPFVATRKWFELYPKESVKLPDVPSDDEADLPGRAFRIRPPNYGLAESDLRDCLRGYWASVSLIDAQLGRVMETLEKLKLIDNTIIVFFSDNGFLLGEHGQWQKQMLFDESPRVPLIIAAPGMKGNGVASPRAVELLDVYPTIRALAKLPEPPQKLEGRSLVPLLNEPTMPSDRPAYSQVTRRMGKGDQAKIVMAYSVHTERWRFTDWGPGPGGGLELYDHQHDPNEWKNLAKAPGHEKVVAEMKKLLEPVATMKEPTTQPIRDW